LTLCLVHPKRNLVEHSFCGYFYFSPIGPAREGLNTTYVQSTLTPVFFVSRAQRDVRRLGAGGSPIKAEAGRPSEGGQGPKGATGQPRDQRTEGWRPEAPSPLAQKLLSPGRLPGHRGLDLSQSEMTFFPPQGPGTVNAVNALFSCFLLLDNVTLQIVAANTINFQISKLMRSMKM